MSLKELATWAARFRHAPSRFACSGSLEMRQDHKQGLWGRKLRQTRTRRSTHTPEVPLWLWAPKPLKLVKPKRTGPVFRPGSLSNWRTCGDLLGPYCSTF